MRRPGFGLIEVIVALVVFAIGALGAAALTAHAARMATRAQQQEAATRQAATLLDSLVAAAAPSAGALQNALAEYRWTVASDSAGRDIRVDAVPTGATDTIRLAARRAAFPPVIGTW